MPRKGWEPATLEQRRRIEELGLKNRAQLRVVERARERGIDFRAAGITEREYAWAVSLKGVRSALYRLAHGRLPTEEELRQYEPGVAELKAYFETHRAKADAEQRAARLGIAGQPVPVKRRTKQKTFLEQLSEYYDIESLSPNDQRNLEQLAFIQSEIEHLNQILYEGRVEIGPGEWRVLQIKERGELHDQLTRLVTASNRLEQTMGIDRTSRDKRAAEKAGPDQWAELLEETERFWEDHIIKLGHCGIEQAWWVPSFPELETLIRFTCSRCGKPVIHQMKDRRLAARRTSAEVAAGFPQTELPPEEEAS